MCPCMNFMLDGDGGELVLLLYPLFIIGIMYMSMAEMWRLSINKKPPLRINARGANNKTQVTNSQ